MDIVLFYNLIKIRESERGIEKPSKEMDSMLCDDLIKDILQRLPHPSRLSACLVCKRWLSLLRSSSTTSLTLCVHFSLPFSAAAISLSSVLSHYPSLSNLTLQFARRRNDPHPTDALLLAIAAAPCACRLSNLWFLPDSFLSTSTLLSSALSFPSLTSLSIASLFPLSFRWLSSLPSLKSFSLILWEWPTQQGQWMSNHRDNRFNDDDECANNSAGLVPLMLECLSLSYVPCNDLRLAWLWRRCSNLRKLRLRSCDTKFHHPPIPPIFLSCLSGLQSLELYTCGNIGDQICLSADRFHALTSFVSRCGMPDKLQQFIRRRGAGLHTLQLLHYLNDDILFAIAANDGCNTNRVFGSQLKVLGLKYCYEVTVKGLRALALSPAIVAIEELALVDCNALECEPGLLTLLIQSMQRLQKLDLSMNDKLADNEIESMLEKCSNLVDIRLRECTSLTCSSVLSLLKHCGHQLQVVDITSCPRIQNNAIEKLVLNACELRELMVEEIKVSQVAKGLLSIKGCKFCTKLDPMSAEEKFHQSSSEWFPFINQD